MSNHKIRHQLLQRNMFSGGGGGGGATEIEQAPTPADSPPVTSSSPEVVQANQDVLRQSLMMKGVKSTTHAGDTGNYLPGQGGGAPGSGLPPMPMSFRPL